jgi:hypothetical protein
MKQKNQRDAWRRLNRAKEKYAPQFSQTINWLIDVNEGRKRSAI